MAKAPARKTSSKKAPTKETTVRKPRAKPDPFTPFENWLKYGPATKERGWPLPWESEIDLTPTQKRIVGKNAKLLLNRDAWKAHVDAFEAAIATLPNEKEQSAKRAEYEIRFDRHDFGNNPKGWDFSDYRFPCSLSFNGAQFGAGDVAFDGAQFGTGNVWFNGAQFGNGNVSFIRAQFGNGDVLFREAQFGDGDVSFYQVQFGDGDVSFAMAQFGNGNISFRGGQFGEGDVSFDEAHFGDGDVRFMPETQKLTPVSAADTGVEGNLTVKGTFPKSVNFRRLKATETAGFSGRDVMEIPDFRDVKFDRPPEVANMEVPAPKMGWIGKTKNGKRFKCLPFKLAQNRNDVAKLRKLKAMALAANDHEMDGDFFAKEMLAKRGVETTGWIDLFLNSLYYWLSNFGQSYLRPIGWLLFSFANFTVAYVYTIGFKAEPWLRLEFSWKLSALSTLPFVGGLFRFSRSPKDHETRFQKLYDQMQAAGVDIDWMILMTVIQSFIGAVLLFLLLLALRNKFRLK